MGSIAHFYQVESSTMKPMPSHEEETTSNACDDHLIPATASNQIRESRFPAKAKSSHFIVNVMGMPLLSFIITPKTYNHVPF